MDMWKMLQESSVSQSPSSQCTKTLYENVKRKGDKMSNNLSGTTNEKRCEYCGGKTYIAVTKEGTPYPKWNSNPFKENTLICGKCYRNLLYRKALPPIHVRRKIRKDRIAKRICYKCGGKTNTQESKTTSHDYQIWHRHPTISGEWLCARCHSNRINEPKKKFKTKEECYKYISKLFSGTGNPMYGNHTLNLGRVYTEERNRRVAEAVKKWAETHQEHYRKIGVLGALKARKLGLFGLPTGLEIKMVKALRKHKIRYVAQYNYGIGIMDFYLPEGNIALFVDGGIWHADPRLYDAEDILFFKFKTSRKEWKNAIAKDVWKKDTLQNSYLKSKGYTVIRYWEKEIESDIDSCIKLIRSRIQEYRNKHQMSHRNDKGV
jgi:DNA mismatch endonuclease (patch repair protein)